MFFYACLEWFFNYWAANVETAFHFYTSQNAAMLQFDEVFSLFLLYKILMIMNGAHLTTVKYNFHCASNHVDVIEPTLWF